MRLPCFEPCRQIAALLRMAGSHADRSLRRSAACDCRGIRRMHPVLLPADCEQAPISRYQSRLRMIRSHADRSLRRSAACDCRGIRRMHPVLLPADCEQAPISRYQSRLRMAQSYTQKKGVSHSPFMLTSHHAAEESAVRFFKRLHAFADLVEPRAVAPDQEQAGVRQLRDQPCL